MFQRVSVYVYAVAIKEAAVDEMMGTSVSTTGRGMGKGEGGKKNITFRENATIYRQCARLINIPIASICMYILFLIIVIYFTRLCGYILLQ